MLLVSNRFGGLADRLAADLIGPNLAADLSNVVLDSQGIAPQAGLGTSLASLAGTIRSLYKYNSTYILSTDARQYIETGGLLLYCVSGKHPQKSSDGTTWANLGIQKPQAACSAAAGAAGSPNGSYNYFVVFTSSLGGESAPGPAASVTVTNKRVDLSAIPTHLGTGDITSGQNTITNVTNISAWQVGMRLIGQVAAGTSAPAASVGIPADATITAINTGTNTLTISANATQTAASIRLTDPQYNGRKIYRTGGSQGSSGLVASLTDMTTQAVTDNTADSDIGAALSTEGFIMPVEFDCWAVSPQGVVMAAKGRTLYPSESALPWHYSTTTFTANETVKAMAHYAGSFAALTVATIYVLPGTTKSDFYLVNTPTQQGCAERDTVIDMGDALFFLSPDGICAFDGRNTVVISKEMLADATMAAISATNAKAARFNETYMLFHSGGWLIYNPRQDGSPWNKGTLTTNEITACHYNRIDDKLYVVRPDGAGTGEAREWGAGAALTWSYRTGDWHGEVEGLEDFYRSGRLVHNGAVTLTPVTDGTSGTQKSFSRASQGPSDFWISRRGLRLALLMGGTGTVNAIYADLGTESRRA